LEISVCFSFTNNVLVFEKIFSQGTNVATPHKPILHKRDKKKKPYHRSFHHSPKMTSQVLGYMGFAMYLSSKMVSPIAKRVQDGALHPPGISTKLKTTMLIRSELRDDNITKPNHEKKSTIAIGKEHKQQTIHNRFTH
jgi:hypothetical protein